MRLLIAACLLAGCYKPSTDSCYYACATQGTPCPSGLTCVAGMCAAPGDDCSAAVDDGGIDSGPLPDVAGAACGDGTATPGEVCYDMPIPLQATGNPRFAQLGDRDGDGDVDLIYVDSSTYQFHLNTGGMLAVAALQGPPTPNLGTMLLANLNGIAGVELVDTTTLSEIRAFTAPNGGPYNPLFVRTTSFPPAIAMAFGRTTTSPIGALAVSHGSELAIYRFDSPTLLTQTGNYPIVDGQDVAIGQLSSDTFEDVAVATSGGAVVFLGSSLNLGSQSQVGPSVRLDGVEIGDFDRDGLGDIAFVFVVPTTGMGTVGTLRGRADGTYFTAVTQQVPDLNGRITVADIDLDGKTDVIGFQKPPPPGVPTVLIFRGKPDGSLDLPIKIPVPGTTSATHLSARGDYNGDMVTDIILTDTVGRKVVVIPSKP